MKQLTILGNIIGQQSIQLAHAQVALEEATAKIQELTAKVEALEKDRMDKPAKFPSIT